MKCLGFCLRKRSRRAKEVLRRRSRFNKCVGTLISLLSLLLGLRKGSSGSVGDRRKRNRCEDDALSCARGTKRLFVSIERLLFSFSLSRG